MSVLENIRRPVSVEMDSFESYFSQTMKSNIPLLKIILNYILRRKGKQMRPMVVFLSARLNGEITEKAFVAATFVELLHTATLVHDDVVDDANERRGFLSINALWNAKIAVLTGDYLLSRGLLLSVEKEAFDLLKIISEAVQAMSEGELFQLQKSRKFSLTEADYYKIITMKTASLLAACTASGAQSVTDDEEKVQAMKEFGENVGIAFQIRDDILDYEGNGLTGKPSGNDIKERKITLPLIYALSTVSGSTHRRITGIVKSRKKSRAEIQSVVSFVKEQGGIDYANRSMILYRDKALAILETYPESEVRESLRQFVLYTTERKK